MDARSRPWISTDRPGEWLSLARPRSDVEIMSVRGSHRHWREAHGFMTIAAVARSRGSLVAEWRTRGRSMSTGQGGVMAIEAGEVHETTRLHLELGVADFDVVHVAHATLEDAARRVFGHSNFHFKSSVDNAEPAFDAVQQLARVIEADAPSFVIEGAVEDVVFSAVAHLGEARRSLPKTDLVRDFRLRKVSEFLRAPSSERPSLETLAGQADLHPCYLSHLFKKAYGVSMGQYWNAFRLQRAAERLKRGARVLDVTAELGYTDEPYFCRVFKKHYGVPPGALAGIYKSGCTSRIRG
jgi:AraC-like DNA-binding protein